MKTVEIDPVTYEPITPVETEIANNTEPIAIVEPREIIERAYCKICDFRAKSMASLAIHMKQEHNK